SRPRRTCSAPASMHGCAGAERGPSMSGFSGLATAPAPALRPNFDVARIREDFPIFRQRIYGKPLVFLDSAASAQKPRQVLDAMRTLYESEYANVHRGVYWLSQRATDRFEGAREK